MQNILWLGSLNLDLQPWLKEDAALQAFLQGGEGGFICRQAQERCKEAILHIVLDFLGKSGAELAVDPARNRVWTYYPPPICNSCRIYLRGI